MAVPSYTLKTPLIDPVMAGKLLESHKSLTFERAAQIDARMVELAKQLATQKKQYDDGLKRYFGNPRNRDKTVSELKSIEAEYTKTYKAIIRNGIERYGRKASSSWLNGLLNIAKFVGAAGTLYTGASFVGGLSSGTISLPGLSTGGAATNAAGAAGELSIGADIAVNAGIAQAGGSAVSGSGVLATLTQVFGSGSSVVKTISSLADIVGAVSDIGGSISGVATNLLEAEQAIANAEFNQQKYLQDANSLEFLGDTAIYNAKAANESLLYERERAKAEEARLRRQSYRTIQSARTVYGASGVTLDGSAQDVVSDIAQEGELNVAMSNFESRQRQRSILVQRDQFLQQFQQYIMSADNARANATKQKEIGQRVARAYQGAALLEGVSSIPAITKGISGLLTALEGNNG